MGEEEHRLGRPLLGPGVGPFFPSFRVGGSHIIPLQPKRVPFYS